jgi:hypothetical protein
MKFELLANEILLDVFEFLNCFHLLYGFYYLNLSKLTLNILSNCWNGYEWEKILTNHVLNIKIFRFKMDFTCSRHIDKSCEKYV